MISNFVKSIPDAYRFLSLAICLVSPATLFAQSGTYTWTGGGGTNGSATNSLNWVGGVTPPTSSTATILNFTSASVPASPAFNTSYSVNQLNFANANYTVINSGYFSLYQDAGTNPLLSLSTAHTVRLAANVYAANPFTANVAAGGRIELDNYYGSGVTITKSGGGTFSINSVLSGGGSIDVQAGTFALGYGARNLMQGYTATLATGATLDLSAAIAPTISTVTGGGTIALGHSTLTTSGTFGGSLTGAGRVILNGVSTLSGTNSHAGGTQVTGFSLTISGDAALGAAGGLLALNSSATLNINSATTLNRPVLAGSAINTNGFNVTVAGSLSGLSSVSKINGGVLTLNAAGGLYQHFSVTAGGVALGHASALQFTPIVLSAGTTLDLGGFPAVTVGALYGSANVALGATHLTQRALTFTPGGGYTGVLSGSGGITLDQAGQSGVMTFTNSDTYSGPTNLVRNAFLSLTGANGAIASSPTVSVTGGGITLGDGTTNNNSNRLGDAAAVTLNGGTFQLLSSNVAGGTSETVASLGLTGGRNVIALTPNATGPTQLSATGPLSRSGQATLLVVANNLGLAAGANNTNLTFGSTPPGSTGGGGGAGTTTIDVLPYAVGGPSATPELVTYGATGLRPLNTATEYVTSMTSGSGTYNNVRLSSAATVASATEINALVVKSGGSVTGAGPLKVRSGAVLLNGGTVGVGTLDFGTAEGVIHSTATTTLPSVLTGSNGVTYSGGGVSPTGTNLYTGPTTVNGATLTIAANANLGAAGNAVSVNGGMLSLPNSFNLTRALTVEGIATVQAPSTSQPITLSGPIDGAGTLRLSGAITLTNTNSHTGGTTVAGGGVIVTSDAALGHADGLLTLAGGTYLQANAGFTSTRSIYVSGSNSVQIYTDGTNAVTLGGRLDGYASLNLISYSSTSGVNLTGPNNLGGLILNSGFLGVASDESLGSPNAYFYILNGRLRALGSFTMNGLRSLYLTTATFDTNGFDVTIPGTVNTYSGTTTLTKAGTGTLSLYGQNSFTGSVVVAGGTLRVLDNVNLGVSSNLTFTGGTLQICRDLTTNRAVTIDAGGATFDTNGSTLTLTGTILGTGPLTKAGAGELVLPLNATRTWNHTTVTGGLLALNGGTMPAGNVTVSGGTLRLNLSSIPLNYATVNATPAIPSADTFSRVFAKLDPTAFAAGFGRWMASACEATGLVPIAIDGKSVRGSKKATATGCLHLVSAWASDARLTLGQVSVADKSHEIAAIPELLSMLDLKGVIVTLDAAGCQKAVARQIRERGGTICSR
jgi:fibronectin-binding autotransporter adhesin